MNIAFYSYKGGVGRTQTLIGVGLELVRLGKRVCLVDVDVEAPGIHHLLGLQPEENQSLIDHLVLQDMGLLPTRVMAIEQIHGKDLKSCFNDDPIGKLFVLPSLPDRAKLHKIPQRQILGFFRESLLHLEKALALDFILLDSRTGFARFAPLALRSADAFVLIARVDDQNARGMKELLDITRAKPRLVVASMVPDADFDITEEMRDDRIRRFQAIADGQIDLFIPFDKRLLFGDCLPPIHLDRDCPIRRATIALAERLLDVVA